MTDTLADAPARPDADGFARDWAEWHARHEAARTDGHGFLAVVGLHWLDAAPARYPGAPGRWSTDEHGPVVELDADELLELDGRPLAGRHAFGPVDSRGVVLHAGRVRIEVARRGERVLLRPRDPAHPYLARYTGTPAYPADPAWAVPGRFVPAAAGETTTVASVAEGLEHVYGVRGVLEFEVGGVPQRLTAFNGGTPDSLFVLFADATSGVTTYAAARSLTVPAPSADGRVVLDFNRAVNLPCAYTDHATCPLPPAGNRLAVAIEAGEQTPHERAS